MSHRVFVLEPVIHSLANAESYGDIVYLFEQPDHKPPIWSDAFIDECYRRLESHRYDCDRDFILVSGSQSPLTLLIGNLTADHDTVNLLLFDGKTREYVQKSIISV